MFLSALTGLLMSTTACEVRHVTYCDSISAAKADGMLINVDYGYHGDKLDFVVMQSAKSNLVQMARLTSEVGSNGKLVCYGFIILPDGSKVDLPTSGEFFEYRSGVLKRYAIPCNRHELLSFLDTEPKTFTFDALTNYVTLYRSTNMVEVGP